ncbi:RNA-3'-phosphate cyclase family protein [Piedraia hortae CBS 480.64]|uniref:RNA-3'-phosphate cyclase family protein n=1 Tax=Piedraia hortae CBS 480.64 TaxID=1314780 RepID=A0A6A7BV30_9PEZI|nr:RNA-3'-phosphate cyclase family protein [Piedraia hortae CBS 480.64]
MSTIKPLIFDSPTNIPHLLILSTLTSQPIILTSIRPTPSSPGLAPHEVSLLHLLSELTGSKIQISPSGTRVSFTPGLIVGGSANLTLPRENTRGASYFILPILTLSPFAQKKIELTLTGEGVIPGATARDISVETLRGAILPYLRPLGVERNITLRTGRQEVVMTMGNQVQMPKTLHLLHAGKIKRVRGTAYSTGVPVSMNARVIDGVKGMLAQFGTDVYILSDTNGRGERGFGVSVTAETTGGCFYSADEIAPRRGGVAAEEIGRKAALQLLEVVEQGGCVPLTAAPTVLLLMVFGGKDVGRVTLGRDVVGSETVVNLARSVRKLGLSGWGLREASESESGGDDAVVVSVVGAGIGNVGRKVA